MRCACPARRCKLTYQLPLIPLTPVSAAGSLVRATTTSRRHHYCARLKLGPVRTIHHRRRRGEEAGAPLCWHPPTFPSPGHLAIQPRRGRIPSRARTRASALIILPTPFITTIHCLLSERHVPFSFDSTRGVASIPPVPKVHLKQVRDRKGTTYAPCCPKNKILIHPEGSTPSCIIITLCCQASVRFPRLPTILVTFLYRRRHSSRRFQKGHVASLR